MWSNQVPTPAAPGAPARNPAVLHRAFGVGMIASVVAVVMGRQFLALGNASDDPTPTPAYVLSAVSFLMSSAALIVLKPRVPARPAGQTVQAYWTNRETMQKVMLVWFIADGAGVTASLSYFLGGGLVAAALIAAALAVFWMNGPGVFERQ